jgi:Phosphatidylinositol N-acetylglucosaminyltransferase
MPRAQCLWQDSALPDNHVDEHFLDSLVLKREAAWSYWHVVSSASAIMRQMSIVGMVSAITWHLYQVRRLQADKTRVSDRMLATCSRAMLVLMGVCRVHLVQERSWWGTYWAQQCCWHRLP